MNEELIIRKEANDFYEWKIRSSGNAQAIDDFHEIKGRLYDFYSSESKAMFLDEIEVLIKADLQRHRDRSHGGFPGDGCSAEINPEKLLFYIKQELETLPVIIHQKFAAIDMAGRDKVFISYSHLDKEYLTDVQRHFKPFLSKINYWDDSKIIPGQKWKEEIEKAISEAKVAILLVSTDFLGSDFITTKEIPPLLSAAEKEGAVILIVIIKPCAFEAFDNLNKYQTVNPPNNPLTRMGYDEKEELFVNLVRQTKKILENSATN